MGCMYCEENENLALLMAPICELPSSRVYLFRNQAYRGRCIVAAGNHAEELYELSDEELQGFMQDVKRVCRAVAGTVHPEKINRGLYGDTCKHVHWHIVPKQKGGPDFGGVFQMQPQPQVLLSEAEFETLIEQIREKL